MKTARDDLPNRNATHFLLLCKTFFPVNNNNLILGRTNIAGKIYSSSSDSIKFARFISLLFRNRTKPPAVTSVEKKNKVFFIMKTSCPLPFVSLLSEQFLNNNNTRFECFGVRRAEYYNIILYYIIILPSKRLSVEKN